MELLFGGIKISSFEPVIQFSKIPAFANGKVPTNVVKFCEDDASWHLMQCVFRMG